jgi:type IV pilus assembly protein PilP
MKNKLREMGGLIGYVATALVALLLASWVSTLFLGRAVSQETAPPPPPPTAEAPPPPPGNGDASTSNSAPGAPAQDPKLGLSNKKNPLADIIEDYNYSPRDKRDPFQPFEHPKGAGGIVGPLWPLQGFDLDQLHLVGIIWDVRNPKAMITDPTGKGYVVRVNERIGRNNGYIARIREGEIVVVESITNLEGKLNYTTKILKLQSE